MGAAFVMAKCTGISARQKQYRVQKVQTNKDVTHSYIIQMPTGFLVVLPPPLQV